VSECEESVSGCIKQQVPTSYYYHHYLKGQGLAVCGVV
jgi:hypothetical protein